MRRRHFLQQGLLATAGLSVTTTGLGSAAEASPQDKAAAGLDPAQAQSWLAQWRQKISASMGDRYCDRETGEELGWLVSHFLNGFYYGHRLTGEPKWSSLLADWTESWLKRQVMEPDGFAGWPKKGAGGRAADAFYSDSLLGEAMAFRPVVLMVREIRQTPALREQYGPAAERWLQLAERTFAKWEARACWREVEGGGLWVVPDFGLDAPDGKWTAGYAEKATTGFSNPANKQNGIALWLLAMADVTGKAIYRDRAAAWFRLMKKRMRLREAGRFLVWNYWDPAGPWDYYANGNTRHWVGVHPNGGYYDIDVMGIVDAFEHGLVFTREDIQRLIATQKEFMWDGQLEQAHFQRIDGGKPDIRWKNSPGELWTALVHHDAKLREIFLANHRPGSWGGIVTTPWFLLRERERNAKPL